MKVTGSRRAKLKSFHGLTKEVASIRLVASLCFHSCGKNWSRPSKGAVAPLYGDKEESLLL
jgi:hypothetical protein